MKDTLIVVAIIALFIFAIASLLLIVSDMQCEQIEEVSGRDTKYLRLSGCYIRDDDGTWVQYEKWRVVQ